MCVLGLCAAYSEKHVLLYFVLDILFIFCAEGFIIIKKQAEEYE